MARMRDRLDAPVLIGVGAAFDFHAGLVPQAPTLMQRCGLEWLYRLRQEPRRLWRRYSLQPALRAGLRASVRRHAAGPELPSRDAKDACLLFAAAALCRRPRPRPRRRLRRQPAGRVARAATWSCSRAAPTATIYERHATAARGRRGRRSAAPRPRGRPPRPTATRSTSSSRHGRGGLAEHAPRRDVVGLGSLGGCARPRRRRRRAAALNYLDLDGARQRQHDLPPVLRARLGLVAVGVDRRQPHVGAGDELAGAGRPQRLVPRHRRAVSRRRGTVRVDRLDALGGGILGAPSVVSRTTNHVDVYARGTGNALYQRSWMPGGWSDWFDARPRAARLDAGRGRPTGPSTVAVRARRQRGGSRSGGHRRLGRLGEPRPPRCRRLRPRPPARPPPRRCPRWAK